MQCAMRDHRPHPQDTIVMGAELFELERERQAELKAGIIPLGAH